MAKSFEGLVECAQRGDARAFDRLVGEHQQAVFALAYRILRNYEDAADIQQETFVLAWKSLRKFRGQSSFSTWLHRITLNLCLSRKRRKSREVSDPEIERFTGDRPEEEFERKETLSAIRAILGGIPPTHRALIVLRDVEGRSIREIGKILNCSETSVRTRLCKARKILRERVRSYWMEEADEM